DNHPTTIFKYFLNWSELNGAVILDFEDEIDILDEDGAPLELHYMQGGVFSSSGDLLYLVSGYHTDTDKDREGVHVFDTHDMQSWIRVEHSTNGNGYFNYEFHPGWSRYEEPEGITILDLDDRRAPGILGQLHVLLLDNEIYDDVYLKHYTGTIYVNHAHTGKELGTPAKPFNTVWEANDIAWDGARIKVKAGSYPETLTISKQVELVAEGGIVFIGK
ncbi:MAG: hypothetical protein O7D34_11220, partial [Ignavibacteria bacterium]|nr:hypothetical protein [Ignavibacteria bacterium]